MPYNANDPRQIRKREKELRSAESARERATNYLMRTPDGRVYVHDLLERSHIFQSSFSNDPYQTAFAEGERNVGLQILVDIIRWCPDQYIAMMREANDKETSNGRSPTDNPGRDGDADRPDADPDDDDGIYGVDRPFPSENGRI